MKTSFRMAHAFAFAALFGWALPSGAADLRLVTTNDAAVNSPVSGGGDSRNPIISRDGRYVLFASTAANLIPGGSNSVSPPGTLPKLNVFLRDRTLGATTLVSVNRLGRCGGNGDSLPVAISTNGQWVLFESEASDLVATDTNNATDVFMRDMLAGTTTLVSVNTNGAAGSGASWQSDMSWDGRYVAFSSAASDLVGDDTNRVPDIFVRDLQAQTTVLASPGAVIGSGTPCSSDSPAITPDGRYVAFLSSAVGLVPGYTVPNEVYVRDLVAGTTVCVSTDAHQALSGTIISYNHALSDDGRYVAFEASPSAAGASGFVFRFDLSNGQSQRVATNAVAVRSGSTGFRHFRTLTMTPDGGLIAFVGQTNNTSQIYVWNAQIGATELATKDLVGNPAATSSCDYPVFNDTGRFLAFLSSGANLVTNTVVGGFHLYFRDLQQQVTALLDANEAGIGSTKDFLSAPSLTADGSMVAFDCTDADLVPGDNNRAYDVFVSVPGANATELISSRDGSLPSETPAGIAAGPALSLSTDGRFVAFASVPGDLLAGCTNQYRAVFVRDLLNGSNILASVDTNGLAGLDRNATEPAISGDGRFVTFSSSADNLVPRDANKLQDVFLRDLQEQRTILVSVATDLVTPGNAASGSPQMNRDGTVVLFRSRATNLTPGPWVTAYDSLFVRKIQTGVTYTVSPSGVSCAAMSPDGRWVGFGGATGNMYIWDNDLNARVYTNLTGTVSAIAISLDGQRLAASRGSQVYASDLRYGSNYVLVASASVTPISHGGLQFSADGRFLVFCTGEPLTTWDTNAAPDVYVYDFDLQTQTLTSRTYDSPACGNLRSDSPAISSDGRFVAWRSFANNLVPPDPNGVPDVLLHDRQTGITTALSIGAGSLATANNRSLSPVFSGDGRTLVFQSWASDLSSSDFNQAADIFAVKLAGSPYISAFPLQIIYAPASTQPLRISWPSTSGVTYHVEYKTDLTDTSWKPLNSPITIAGDRAYAGDPAPVVGQRFYRVVAE